MKVYIAGRITGDPDYREKFKKAEEMMRSHGCTVMNPAILPDGFEWEEYMNITMAMLEVCDTIILLPGWNESKGARREYIRARRLGKLVLELTPTWRESMNQKKQPTEPERPSEEKR